MDKPLRILMLEDSAEDALLNEYALTKAGLVFENQRVERLEDFLCALTSFAPDVVLADYHLPSFNGLQALALLRERDPTLPFIFVTGAMGEEMAVDSLHHGADDYILKDRIQRLPAAVNSALQAAAQRKALQQAQRIRDHQATRSLTLLKLPKLSETLSEPDFLRAALDMVESLTSSRMAFLYFVHAQEHKAELSACSTAASALDVKTMIGQAIPLETKGTWTSTIELGFPVVANDLPNDLPAQWLPRGIGPVQHMAWIPIVENEKLVMLALVVDKNQPY